MLWYWKYKLLVILLSRVYKEIRCIESAGKQILGLERNVLESSAAHTQIGYTLAVPFLLLPQNA